MSEGTTNNQIVDSVTTASLLVGGQAPSQSFGMLDTVMAETLGMAMHNAVMRQQASGTVNAAAVTAACARMLQVPTQFGGPLPPPDPPLPPTPPGILPIQPTPPPSPNGISEALARAKAAINVILNGVQTGSQEEAEANKALATLNQATTPQVPPIPPAPPTPPVPPVPPTH
jgi:hypothetical protein